MQCFIVFRIVIVRGRFEFAAAEIAAATAATTAEAAGDYGAYNETGLLEETSIMISVTF